MPPSRQIKVTAAPETVGRILDLRRRIDEARAGVLSRYRDDPDGFVTGYLGEHLWSKQRQIMQSVRDHRLTAVRSCHGIGKSFTVSRCVAWWGSVHPPEETRIVTTAPTFKQVRGVLWQEIRKCAPKLPGDVLQLEWQIDGNLVAQGIKPDDYAPDAFQGIHAKHLLVVLDEGNGVPPALWRAAVSLATSEHSRIIVIGNPDDPSGKFAEVCRPGSGWHTIQVGYRDTPNFSGEPVPEGVAAKLIGPAWIEDARRMYGEGSPLWTSKVEGEFPEQAEDALIRLSIARAAAQRELPAEDFPNVLGVDVARLGSDKTIIMHRRGRTAAVHGEHHHEDTMVTAGRVKNALAETGATNAAIDADGLGAGVFDRLMEQGLPAQEMRGGFRARDSERFANCLTGDARVLPLGRLLRVYRSRYDGPMFRLKTASGDEFTATPNHNVLTLRGWVAVKSLRVGDELCDAGRGQRALLADPGVSDMPPKISEIYHAAKGRSGSERVQGSCVDFHGDAPVGDVDVVEVCGDLQPVDPSFGQQGNHGNLVWSLHGQPGFAGGSGGSYPRGVLRSERRHADRPPPCLAPVGGARSALAVREPACEKLVGLGVAARGDASFGEDAVQPVVANPEFPQQSPGGFACGVAYGDRVLINLPGVQRDGVRVASDADFVLGQDAADDVGVDLEVLSERVDGFAGLVAVDQVAAVDVFRGGEAGGFGAAAWLDAVFAQDLVNGGPVSSEALLERCRRLAGEVSTDEIVGIEKVLGAHEPSFVYTLETSTGAYRSSSVVHRNCRAEWFWGLRQRFEDGDISIPDDEELLAQLTAIKYQLNSRGQIILESKDQMRKRGMPSPDKADALAYCFAAWDIPWSDVYGSPQEPAGGADKPEPPPNPWLDAYAGGGR